MAILATTAELSPFLIISIAEKILQTSCIVNFNFSSAPHPGLNQNKRKAEKVSSAKKKEAERWLRRPRKIQEITEEKSTLNVQTDSE